MRGGIQETGIYLHLQGSIQGDGQPRPMKYGPLWRL
jgi:hypothetical protein